MRLVKEKGRLYLCVGENTTACGGGLVFLLMCFAKGFR